MTSTSIQILARCPYFRGIPTELLHALSMHAEEQRMVPGQVLATRLDAAENVWIIGDGRVEVRRQQGYKGQRVEVAVSILKPGMIFGHVGLLSEQPPTASWVCAAPGRLVRFERKAFERLIQDTGLAGQAFRRALILALGNQLRAVNLRLSEFLADPKQEAEDRRDLLLQAIEAAGQSHQA